MSRWHSYVLVDMKIADGTRARYDVARKRVI
jgi:hypothetical protein